MANTITLFKQYVSMLDEVYKLSSLTSDLDGAAELAKQGANANELIIPKLSMQGLADYSRNGGYVDGDVTLTNESVKCNFDRGRMFTVDTLDNAETAGLAFGRLAGEFIRTKVVPELDAFRFAAYAQVAGISTVDGANLSTGTSVVEAIRAAINRMDEDEVPQEQRYLYITPTLLGLVEDLDTTKSKKVLEGFAKIVKVPQSRFYTEISQKSGKIVSAAGGQTDETAGGYAKASDGKNINFMVIHKPAVIQYQKHTVPKVIAPEQNQTADAWKFGYRTVGIATADIKKIIEGVALAELGLSFGQASGVFDNQPAWVTQLITWGTILGGLGLMIFGIATADIKKIIEGAALMQLGIRYGTASGAFDTMPNWLKQVITWGSLLTGVGMLIADLSSLPGGLGMLVAGLGMVAAGVSFGNATDSFDGAATLLKNIYSDCKDFWDEHFAEFFTKDYWDAKWENIKSSCDEWWDGVKTWFSENVAPKFTKEYWSAKFDSIRSSAVEKWEAIKNWFTANVAPKFTKDYWVRKFDSMKQGAKSTINGIIECFERGINNIITRINKLSWDIPDWVPGVGGKRFGFNISTVSLPRLATGTVVPANFGEFAAILGDNKREPEVVSPVSTIKQALREVMNEFGDRPVQITVYTTLDGRIIGRSVVEYHNGVVAQTGVTPLKGV